MGLIYWLGRHNGTGVYRMKMSGRHAGQKGLTNTSSVCVCAREREHLYVSMCDTLSEKDKC